MEYFCITYSYKLQPFSLLTGLFFFTDMLTPWKQVSLKLEFLMGSLPHSCGDLPLPHNMEIYLQLVIRRKEKKSSTQYSYSCHYLNCTFNLHREFRETNSKQALLQETDSMGAASKSNGFWFRLPSYLEGLVECGLHDTQNTVFAS